MEWPSATYIGMAASKWCNEAALRLAIVASQCKRFWASSGMQISSLISWTPSLPIFSSCLDVHARLTLSSSGRQLVIFTSNSSGSPVDMLHWMLHQRLKTSILAHAQDESTVIREIEMVCMFRICSHKCDHRQGQMASVSWRGQRLPTIRSLGVYSIFQQSHRYTLYFFSSRFASAVMHMIQCDLQHSACGNHTCKELAVPFWTIYTDVTDMYMSDPVKILS